MGAINLEFILLFCMNKKKPFVVLKPYLINYLVKVQKTSCNFPVSWQIQAVRLDVHTAKTSDFLPVVLEAAVLLTKFALLHHIVSLC